MNASTWPRDGSIWTIPHAGRALNSLDIKSGADLVAYALFAIGEMVDRGGTTAAGVEDVISESDHNVPENVSARLVQLKGRQLATPRKAGDRVPQFWRLTPLGRERYQFPIPDPPGQSGPAAIASRVHQHLESISDPQARDYLQEVALAISANARRVAVVAMWSAAVYEFGIRVERLGFDKFNDALQSRYGQMKRYKDWKVKSLDDLQDVKEEHLLQLLRDVGVIGKGVKDVLDRDYLNLRNKCGHPSDYRPSEKTVEAMLDDLITNVFVAK